MTKTAGWRASRRRVLRIIAGTAASLLLPAGAHANAPLGRRRWQGEVMGAVASIDLISDDRARSDRLIADVLKEVRRLEDLFSLYKPDTAISTLNARGFLPDPDGDFVALMRIAQQFHGRTGGAFDVTVQPLWQLYAGHFSSPGADREGPESDAVERTAGLVDGGSIRISGQEVRFPKAGMGVTLNGIAQGYISDRVAMRLKAEGIERVMVDMGEIVTLGTDEDGQPWRIGLLDGRRPGEISEIVDMVDLAMATSGGYGMTFDAAGRFHHLIDPRTGRSTTQNLAVTVTAPSATLADALSTGFSAMDEGEIAALVRGYPDVGVHVTRADGTVAVLGTFPKRQRL